MLGLIAFALLILACSYWKLSGYLDSEENNNENGEGDLESGKINGDGSNQKGSGVLEMKYLVIMAGEMKPTHLATPVMPSGGGYANNSQGGNSYIKSCSCGAEIAGEKTEVKESGSGSGGDTDEVENRNIRSDSPSSSSDQSH